MIHLRPYQSDLIDRTRAALGRHRSVLLHSPTGSGKTALAAFMAGAASKRGRRTWFIAHRDFLLEQTARTFDKVGIPFGFIAAGRTPFPAELCQICSVGTLQRRLDRYAPPDVIIWDESHHIASASYTRIFEWASSALHIGLTATPARLDGKGLGKYFGEIVPGPSVSWLIAEGFLSPYRAFAPSAPKLSGVHTIAGDYNRGELGEVMDQNQIIGDMVRHYRERAAGMRTVYYCVSVVHSQHVAATFNAAGIPARHLDGTSTTEERISTAREFAEGSLRVITNVEICGEGYDLGSQSGTDVSVEAVGLARPTQSLALHLQQVGRALRPAPDKACAVILDHAGNLLRHGLPDDDREWDLDGVRPRRKAAETVAPVRQCVSCYGVHRPAPRCPYCGHVYVVEGREVEEVAGTLAEVDLVAAREARKFAENREVGMAKDRQSLEAIARARGYKPAWVDHILKARGRAA